MVLKGYYELRAGASTVEYPKTLFTSGSDAVQNTAKAVNNTAIFRIFLLNPQNYHYFSMNLSAEAIIA